MSNGQRINGVAKELSDALARCQQRGIDEQSVRTGLLTITIANFINKIGMQNTLSLFEALPQHIASGIFDKYMNPEIEQNQPPARPLQNAGYQAGYQPHYPDMSPAHQPPPIPGMPQNFIPPQAQPGLHPASQQAPAPAPAFVPSHPAATNDGVGFSDGLSQMPAGRRRLADS
ncbi:hypothetical protein [Sneathiella chinensis]|uniref:Uncharacterized protein n=2 Tax=Alphaproteobacteria TaxID=28211 RepID=A0ABQ5U3T0_9PROT|nr:hypothetical protein [Sneathiella chinensis]GLQ06569.1 hypothetical protein GCM10007924_17900 [Sneathiella chinensis]